VNQIDILSAVGYALKREVPKKDLDKDDIVALQHWVTLLTKVLIFSNKGNNTYIYFLPDFFQFSAMKGYTYMFRHFSLSLSLI